MPWICHRWPDRQQKNLYPALRVYSILYTLAMSEIDMNAAGVANLYVEIDDVMSSNEFVLF